MLSAVLEDFGRIPGVEVASIVAKDLSNKTLQGTRRIAVDEEELAFRNAAGQADYTVVIAPECDEILWRRCAWIEEAGGHSLGSSLDAIHLTGDKRALAQHLIKLGVPCVSESEQYPLVCKPRFGAGSQATFLVRDSEELSRCAAQAREEGWQGELIQQAYIRGQAASVVLFLGPQQQLALIPASQKLSQDGRFHYLGGSLPLPPRLQHRAQSLAFRAATSVSGLRGYVGVDLVLGDAGNGSEDVVIEINPRWTTSYVGLRALAEQNLAEVLLNIVGGQTAREPTWRDQQIQFYADGRYCKSL